MFMDIKPFRQFFLLIIALSLILMIASGQPKSNVKVDSRVLSGIQDKDEVRVIVMLQKDAPASVSEFKDKKRFAGINGYSGKVSKSQFLKLVYDKNVDGIYLDEVRKIALDGSIPLINASLVWPRVNNGSNLTGAGVGVCVIDTGLNYSHPYIGACSNDSFLNGSCSKVPGGYDFVNSDNNPVDDHSHGTHVAGIIASTNDTYRGVAPESMIIPLKACDSGGSCYDSDITSSIDWCVSNSSRFNISVISISLGGGSYSDYCDSSLPYFRDSINSAVAKNISVIIAAGNDYSSFYISSPACIRNATAIVSTTKSDAISSFSNRNNLTYLAAPGSSIVSLDYQGIFSTKSGTSMATPHVSGAFALIAQYRKLMDNSTYSPSEIADAMNSTGKDVNDSSGNGITYRRISVLDALLYLDSSPANITFINQTPMNNSVVLFSQITINASANKTIYAAFLEWNGTVNYSMTKFSGTVYYISFRNFSNGNATYRVFGNNSQNNFGVSQMFYVQMNNSAPNITSFFPLSTPVSISEPSNQTFNVSYNDSDSVTTTWFVNGSNQSSFFNLANFNFTGNYSAAGNYNITVILSDGNMVNFTNWTLVVNNTNRVPSWNSTPQNVTMLEDASVSFNITAYDPDGGNITYALNDSRFTLNATNGSINFTPSLDYFGEIFLNVTASDGILNLSEVIFVNVTPVNDAPSIVQIANISVNVTDWLNITVSASDVDNEFFNYTINHSGFSQLSSGNFSWQTNISSNGFYVFNVSVTDGILTSFIIINATVVYRVDTDLDGVPDIYDTDSDNDGIPDSDDYLIGNNYSFLNLSGTFVGEQLNITINGTSNLSRVFNDTLLINITNASVSLLQFHWNFSNSSLYLNFTLNDGPENSSYGSILVRGLVLQQNTTKNISLRAVNSTISSVCIKDADVSSVNNISYSCNAENESLVSCPGSNSNYSCSLVNDTYNRTYFTISGLRYSAIRQQCADADADGFYVSGCGNGTDCDDSRFGVNPSASEACSDSLDNNCNGQTDEGCSSPSGSSGGGGGGGGGGGISVKQSPKASYFFGLVEPGKTRSMKISNPSIAFTNMTFSSKVSMKSFSLSIEPYNSSLLANAYQYIKVTAANSPADTDLGVVYIYFNVNKSWFGRTGFDKDLVVLKRYEYGVWRDLSVSMTGENELVYSYVAESPGFSLYAVSSKRIPIKPVEVKKEPSNETPPDLTAVTGMVSSSEENNQSQNNYDPPTVENPKFKLPEFSLIVVFSLVPFLVLFALIALKMASSKVNKETDEDVENQKNIEEYIEKSLAYGHNKTQVRASLIDSGFKPQQIDRVLRKY